MSNSTLTVQSGTARQCSAHINAKPQQLVSVGTVNSFESEAWSLIRLFLLKNNLWSLSKSQKREVSTLVSRAELFYTKYKDVQNDPSAALLAYYFAMNLAKAYLIAKDGTLIGRTFNHGLSFSPIKKEYLESKGGSTNVPIFTKLYEEVTGKQIRPGTKFKIQEMFTGVGEAVFQANVLNLKTRIIRLEYVLLADIRDDNNKKVWPVIRMSRSEVSILESNKTMLRKFNRLFEKIELKANERSKYFGSPAFDYLDSIFFQSKKTYDFSSPFSLMHCEDEVKDAFSNRASVNIYDKKLSFDILMPLRGRSNLYFTELFNAYECIYWCSSIIRYDPSVKTLGDKDSELAIMYAEINRFVPYILLREFLSIFSKNRIEFDQRS